MDHGVSAPFRLENVPGRYAVCRMGPGDSFPPGILSEPFSAVIRTQEEISVVCREDRVPEGGRKESGWALFRLCGTFAFTETGVLARLSGVMADAGIPILALSTFDTDYLLIKQDRAREAAVAFAAAGIACDPSPPPSGTGE